MVICEKCGGKGCTWDGGKEGADCPKRIVSIYHVNTFVQNVLEQEKYSG